MEKAFVGAGKAPGIEVWRIENLQPVKLAGEFHGKLHTGDSYILLHTSASKSGALQWAIHFWLGAETSHDEAGIAAYKTVELDDALGGGPVQYREVQGSESQLFLSYFKKTGGVEYLPGGVDSGFKKVERNVYETRLLHLKGKRTVRVSSVPVSKSSLNKGDVFILDKGLKIFLFNGPTANKYEKTKGLEVASNINSDERGGKAELVYLEDDIKNPEFWEPLGGFVDPNSLPEGESDDLVKVEKFTPKLFQISDASGSLQFTAVSAGEKLRKDMLDTNDVFLVHAPGKVFLWIGRKANLNEKKEATAHAVEYLKKHGLADSTPVERVSEGCETAQFKSTFAVWDQPLTFSMSSPPIGTSQDSPVDVAALVARKTVEDTPVDDGSGKLQVWVVKDFKKEYVGENEYGEFHGGDSYILLYTYKKGRSEEYIIYFWLGNDSTADEKGAAALLTVELDDSMGGKPVQVRVTQGKEPAHFRQLFKGKMIVYKGGHASGFKSVSQSGKMSTEDGDANALFHIKGTNAVNTCAVQVNCQAVALNSQDCFVLVTDASVFCWMGKGSNNDENTVATNVATTLAGKYNGKSGREVVQVKEGSEPEEFWTALGGKAEYPTVGLGEAPPRDARLFSASTATGSFRVEEIDNFDQSDLNDEDVFLLDTFTQLFVWIGSQSTTQEKTKAMEFAEKYVTEANDGRDPEIPIVRVMAGKEPPMFSCHFLGWDPEFFSKQQYSDPYEAKLAVMRDAKAKEASAPMRQPSATLKKVPSVAKQEYEKKVEVPAVSPSSPTNASYKDPKSNVFSLSDLQGNLPADVDPARKEQYLDDGNFSSLFGMDKATFDKLPKWKRDAAKKTHGLF